MLRLLCSNSSRAALALLGLFAALIVPLGSAQAASLQGREFFGPVRLEFGDHFQVVLANVWNGNHALVAVRIFNSDGMLIKAVGYGKDGPLPMAIVPNDSLVVEIVGGSEMAPAGGEYTAIAELFNNGGAAHAPLLSAQVVKGADGTAGIWGTGGVALNAIWGTGGVARTGIWGTGGVARTGIWGTGGVARQATFGAFPAVKVAAGETYCLTAQNPYDVAMTIEMSALGPDGVEIASSGELTLNPGKVATLDAVFDGNVIGMIKVIGAGGSNTGPLVTMQVLRSGDGRAGIWGTGGVAYEANAPL